MQSTSARDYATGPRRIFALLGALCALVGLSAQSVAADDFLAVDQAFAPSVERVDADHVAVTWQIADGYYLYRHAFDFKLTDAPGWRAGDAELPPGKTHTDDFFGEVETYRGQVRALVPINHDAAAGTAALPAGAKIELTYQGCADAGLCYPPQKKALAIPPAATAGAAPARSSDAAAVPAADAGDRFVARQDALAERLGGTGWLSALALFFGFGVLLAFTPCILPMIPILSGLIVGSGATPRRAFVLSLAYVVAMALAYALFGVIAGYFGANLQAALQMPAVLLPFAALFVVLALASFGVFELQVPGALRQRLGQAGSARGGLAGAAVMGFLSALIAGPCLAPPLVGALLYISSSGDMLLGGSALFVLGLGLGLPLIVIGTFGARLLPRSGRWMDQVRIFFGVVLLGVALWLTARVIDERLVLAGWGLLTLGYGAYLSTLAAGTQAGLVFKRAAVFLLFVYAGCAAVGVLAGGGRAAQPLAAFTAARAGTAQAPATSAFTRVDTLADLNAALASAAAAGRPAVVDFYADWCVECVQMEHTTFADADVRAALADVAALQVDVTAYDAADRAVLAHFGVYGPPTILFYRGDGAEAADHRAIGRLDAAGFLRSLRRATRERS